MIYVRAALELIRIEIPVHGLAHITGGGLLNLLRLNEAAGFDDRRPAARCRRSSTSSASAAGSPTPEAWEVFNMGCGFVAVVPEAQAEAAAALLAAHHPGTRRIGTVTGEAGRVSAPGVAGDRGRPQRRLEVERRPRACRSGCGARLDEAPPERE